MAKATHRGECQVCGNTQKLPNGLLSAHGYTKQWGFFEGECLGSKRLPFEKSKDLIERAIADAESARASAQELSREFKEGAQLPDNKAWLEVYPRLLTRRFKPMWKMVTIFAGKRSYEDGSEFNSYTWSETEEGTKEELHVPFSVTHRDLDGVRSYLNELYARLVLDKRAKELAKYIHWQQSRIKDWKPTELKPL